MCIRWRWGTRTILYYKTGRPHCRSISDENLAAHYKCLLLESVSSVFVEGFFVYGCHFAAVLDLLQLAQGRLKYSGRRLGAQRVI
jgi:hypothetical protein